MFEPGVIRITCLALMILGVLFGSAGVTLHLRNMWLVESVASGVGQAQTVCLDAARRISGEVTATADTLSLVVMDTADQRTSLTDASGLLAFCPGMEMTYFCMGKACGNSGKVAMRMDLRRSAP
jgi:hypothetical protein